MKSPTSRLNRTRALLTGASLLLGAAQLPAAVVTWDAGDVTTPIGAAFDESGIWLNFFTGSVSVVDSGDGYPSLALGQFQINHNGAVGYVNLVNQTPFFDAAQWVNVGNGVARLAEGDLVDGSSFFTDDFTIIASVTTDFFNSFDDLGTGYIGVNFTDAAVNLYYGYLEVTLNPDFTLTLNSFGYDDTPGTGILAGATAIPEPASAAALAGTALLGLAALRRRRRS